MGLGRTGTEPPSPEVPVVRADPRDRLRHGECTPIPVEATEGSLYRQYLEWVGSRARLD